jgi:hypothetical protein
VHHQIRRILDLSPESAHDVPVGPAECVRDALVGIGAAEVRKGRGRLDPRRRQLDRLERYRLLDLGGAEAQPLADVRRGRLELVAGQGLVLEAPAPVLSPAGRRVYQ